MKCLSKYMVTGLILLSSNFAVAIELAEDGGPPPGIKNHYDPENATEKLNQLKETLSAKYPDIEVSSEISILEKDVAMYKESQIACSSREDNANTFCRESRNPEIKKYLIIAQVLTTGLAGMSDACSKWGKVMDAGNKALTLYQAGCGSWRGYCLSACGDAVKSIKNQKTHSITLSKKVVSQAGLAIAKYTKLNNPSEVEKYQQLQKRFPQLVDKYHSDVLDPELQVKGDYKAVKEKMETCDGYATQLASAGLGLLNMAKSFGEANECDNKTSTAAQATPVDCKIPANKKNNMTCICEDAPRTPGCSSGLDNTVAAMNAESMRSASTSDYVPGAAAKGNVGIDGGANSMELASKISDGGGSSLPGSPSGGSAGLGGGSGGFGGGANSQAAQKATGLNTNILGGDGGGGGGGGWAGSYNDESLRQYLPGGEKDPTGMAGQEAVVTKQITSQGGKSNWEKVRDRYRDNKSSLLGY